MENDQEIGVDRISDMPHHVLEKIQSFLPTKDAIATPILSTRWRTLSPFATPPIKLDLEYPLVRKNYWKRSYMHLDTFIAFVDKLFKTTSRDVHRIDTLRLHCDGYCGDGKANSWVRDALRLKVQELLLEIRLGRSKTLFCFLNGRMTLTRLELGKGFRVLVPNEFRLPNLKMLRLYELKFVWNDGDMFSKLFSGSPRLEDLCLDDCKFEGWEECIRIRSTVLKKLTLIQCGRGNVELEVPNLKVLRCIDSTAKILSSVKSLTAAHIYAGNIVQGRGVDRLDEDEESLRCEKSLHCADDVAVLVSACSKAVHLYLDSSAIVALQQSHGQLPTFQNLTSLALGCMFKSGGWAFLARLLLCTPNLKILVFEEGFIKHKRGYSAFQSLLPNPPLCLEQHLREIRFKVFEEEEDELKLVEYFLGNGNVIQKLILHCLPFKETETKRLLKQPKHSRIDFHQRNKMWFFLDGSDHQLLFEVAQFSRGD